MSSRYDRAAGVLALYDDRGHMTSVRRYLADEWRGLVNQLEELDEAGRRFTFTFLEDSERPFPAEAVSALAEVLWGEVV